MISAPSFPSPASSPNLGGKSQNINAVAHSAEDFEAYVASEFLEHMFSGIQSDPLFGGGQGESIFRSFLLQEYGKSLAASGALGIGAQVKQELLRLQTTEGKSP